MGSNGIEICSKCGREIPRSEQVCVFKGEIVCAECDKKLRMEMGYAEGPRGKDEIEAYIKKRFNSKKVG